MNRFISRIAVLFLSILSVPAFSAETLPVSIGHDDPKLYYVGRFDTRDARGPRSEWSHSMVTLRFRGTAVQARVNDQKGNFWAVVVDDQPAVTIATQPGENVVDLAKDLPAGEHTVQMIRRTEPFVGRSQFLGFALSAGGELLEPKRLTRKIEVIGDSISCGYGNEAPDQKHRFAPATENAHMTYGAIAARAVGAEYICTAWSGKKMAPDNTLPELYDRSLATDKNSAWDFAKWQPDAVLINLSTNDFNKANPDEATWTAAYKQFVLRVRANYPKAAIYLSTSPMLNNGGERKPRDTLQRYLEKVLSDLSAESTEKNVRIIQFAQQKQTDGLGADWHPSVRTHEVMAAKFVEALKADLGWDVAAK